MSSVVAIRCLVCRDVIYSRAPHDWHQCSCKAIFVDGGFTGYVRIGGYHENLGAMKIRATQQELYDDWNYRRNKFGIIKSWLRPKGIK